MADKILLENGVDRLLLEDGVSFLLLEGETVTTVLRQPVFSIQQKKRFVPSSLVPNLLTNTLRPQTTVTGTVNYTNQNDTSTAQGSPIIVGTLARTGADDTSAASGTTSVVGSTNYTNNNDTLAASGSVDTSQRPFVPVFTSFVQRRNINPIVYGSRGVNPQVPTDPVRPDVFIVAQRKPNRFTSFDFPNLLISTFEFQPVAASYPEFLPPQRKKAVTSLDFPNLAIRIVVGPVEGTVNYTNLNDTLEAQGTTVVVGTLATTNNNDTISASGTIGSAVDGTVNYTNQDDTSTSTGSPIVAGQLNTTNTDDLLSANGTPVIQGSIVKTNNNDTLTAAGTSGIVVVGAGTKLPMTGVGS